MRVAITELRDACSAVAKHLHARYGVSVEVASIELPLKGDLDGSRILVGDHNTDEEQLFLVAHLFGHTVQCVLPASLRIPGGVTAARAPSGLRARRVRRRRSEAAARVPPR